MTINVFGNKDWLALPLLKPSGTPLGSHCFYTKPSYESCYSKFGFAVPLNYEGIPLKLIMEPKLPLRSQAGHVVRFNHLCRYLVVGHDGELWLTDMAFPDSKNACYQYSQAYIDRHNDGWWYGKQFGETNAEDRQLVGFLYTNPPLDDVEHFYEEHFIGQQINFVKIENIVNRLNKDFSIENIVSSPEKSCLINNLVNQASEKD